MISDQNGNTYVYDAWNRLVEVKNAAGTVIAQYSYDARGYRITESYPQGGNGVAAGTTNYIYYDADWQAIETRTNGTAASNVTSQMVWSAAYINAAVLQDSYSGGTIQPNSRLYFTQDANWDTTAVVGYSSTSGTWGVVQRYVYSPYGNITVLNADWSTPPAGTQPLVNNLYQGMTLDAVTGLYYERNRNYSPSLGVWISQDPLQYVNGANTYQMEMGGPVGHTDARGTDIYLLEGDDNGGPLVRIFHESVGVGKCGHVRAAFSFGFDGHWHWFPFKYRWLYWSSWTWPGYLMEGEVYKTDGFGKIIKTKKETAAQDKAWLFAMNGTVGDKDVYSILRHNCRMFSQLVFNDAPKAP